MADLEIVEGGFNLSSGAQSMPEILGVPRPLPVARPRAVYTCGCTAETTWYDGKVPFDFKLSAEKKNWNVLPVWKSEFCQLVVSKTYFETVSHTLSQSLRQYHTHV